MNDSKAPLGANRDLHQKLGYGFLGLEAFRVVANFEKLQNVPIILETPVGDEDSVYGEEINLLEWLEGRSKDDEEFISKQKELFDVGAKDRAEHLKKFETKKSKATTAKRSATTDISKMVSKKKKE